MGFQRIVFTWVLALSCLAESAKISNSTLKEIPAGMLRKLQLTTPLQPGRPAHVGAASGLVEIGGQFYAVADDDSAIFKFSKTGGAVETFPLDGESLPVEPAQRKKQKPDYEALVHLNKELWPPQGALLAWPSASSPQRMRAALVPFEANQKMSKPLTIEISPFAAALKKSVKELNIEGVTIAQENILFIQRGNTKGAKSGYFSLDLKAFIEGLKSGQWPKSVDFQKVAIGKAKGVKITLADAVWLKQGLLGIAPAEDTNSAYDDGKVVGTYLVLVEGKRGRVLGRFVPPLKFEGFVARESDKGLRLYLVEDSDDVEKSSHLYEAELPLELLDQP